MTITVGANTTPGTYPITVTGNGGGVQQNTTVTLTVTAAPSFTISASPASLSIAQGNQGTSTITTAVSGGFNSAISLSATGMPTGTTVSFNPSTIAAPGSGSSTMTITVGSTTPAGTYPITVTGNWRRRTAEHDCHADGHAAGTAPTNVRSRMAVRRRSSMPFRATSIQRS